MTLVRLVPSMTILDKKGIAKISFNILASKRRTRRISLITISFRKNKFPDTEFFQLHLSQLSQQDPDSAISRQLPEEPLSASGLQTAAWPAATLTDNLSFSKQNLSEQDLSNISLDELFPRELWQTAFRTATSEQSFHRSEAASEEQAYPEYNFQQLSLEQPSFTEEDLARRSLQQPLPRTA